MRGRVLGLTLLDKAVARAMQPSFAIAFVERSSRRIDEFTRRPAASAAQPSSLYGGEGVGGEETKSCKITERREGTKSFTIDIRT